MYPRVLCCVVSLSFFNLTFHVEHFQLLRFVSLHFGRAKAISAAINISVLGIQTTFGMDPFKEARENKQDAVEAKEPHQHQLEVEVETKETVEPNLLLESLPLRSPETAVSPTSAVRFVHNTKPASPSKATLEISAKNREHSAVGFDELAGTDGGVAAAVPCISATDLTTDYATGGAMAWSPKARGATEPADGYAGLHLEESEDGGGGVTVGGGMKGALDEDDATFSPKVVMVVERERIDTAPRIGDGFEAEVGFEVELF